MLLVTIQSQDLHNTWRWRQGSSAVPPAQIDDDLESCFDIETNNCEEDAILFAQTPSSTAMASGEEEGSDTKFVCPVHDLPTQLQSEVDLLSVTLGADDSEPLQKLVVEQFKTYLMGVDDVIKDVFTKEQLRTAWEKKQFIVLMKSYVETKQTATALGICVSLTYVSLSFVCEKHSNCLCVVSGLFFQSTFH